MVIYTSGTTGRPKGAVHVHGGFLVKIAEECAFQLDIGTDDRFMWVTDMGWIMGPLEVVGAGALGATLVITWTVVGLTTLLVTRGISLIGDLKDELEPEGRLRQTAEAMAGRLVTVHLDVSQITRRLQEEAVSLGSRAASEVISHYGPRPQVSLQTLAAEKGL